MALQWEQTGRWLWQGFDVRKRLVAEVAGLDVWHEETQGGVREVVIDGRYWAAWVYEERLPEQWATAHQAMEAAERTVAPHRAGLSATGPGRGGVGPNGVPSASARSVARSALVTSRLMGSC